MIQNNRVLDVTDYVYEGDYIYFVTPSYCIIGKYNYVEEKFNVVVDYADKINVQGAFESIVKIGHKIYCIPCYADNIYCYNLLTEQFYHLDICNQIFQDMPARKIIKAVEVDGNLYCVCRSPHMVIRVCSKTDECDVSVAPDIEREHDLFSVICRNGFLEYPFQENKLIRFDIAEKKFTVNCLFECEYNDDVFKRLYLFLYDSLGNFWMCNHKGEVLQVVKGEVRQLEMPKDYILLFHDGKFKQPGINGMVEIEGKICFILGSDCRVLTYDLYDHKFEWSEKPEEISFNGRRVYNNYQKIGESILLYNCDGRVFCFWNKERGFFDKFYIKLSAEELAKSKSLQSHFLQYECEDVDLKFYFSFIKALGNDGVFNNETNSREKNNGEIIYDQIMRNEH